MVEPARQTTSVALGTPLGDPSGVWAKVELGGVRYWVHRRFFVDIRSAASPVASTG